MRQSDNLKNAIVKEIAGKLVARDSSRHYWILDGAKWVRYGLRAIATMLHLGAIVISAMFRMVNGSKQAVKHLPVTELAVYTVLFTVLLALSVVLAVNASTLAEVELLAIPVIFITIARICMKDAVKRGVNG